MTVLVVLAWMLGVLLVLVALLLASNLRLELRVDDLHARARLGLAGVAFRLDSDARTLEVRWLRWRLVQRPLGRSDREPPEKPKPRRPKRFRRRRGRRAWPGPDAWRFYRRRLADLLGRVRVERCAGELRIATPDPAVTGMAYGMACALVMPVAARWPRAALAVAPDFETTAPSGWLDLAVRLRLATVVWIALRVAWHERSRAGRARRVETGKEREGDGSA